MKDILEKNYYNEKEIKRKVEKKKRNYLNNYALFILFVKILNVI